MKFPRLLAALFVIGLLISPKANAAVVSVFEPGVITSGQQGSVVIDSGKGFHKDTISLTGLLAANTKIVFTLTASNANFFSAGSSYALTSYPTLGYGIAKGLHNHGLTQSVLHASVPVPTTGVQTATLTIVNNSSTAKYMTAYFDYIISLAKHGKIYLSAQTFATPLPAGIVLFLSALMGLFGFTSYRKARGEA